MRILNKSPKLLDIQCINADLLIRRFKNFCALNITLEVLLSFDEISPIPTTIFYALVFDFFRGETRNLPFIRQRIWKPLFSFFKAKRMKQNSIERDETLEARVCGAETAPHFGQTMVAGWILHTATAEAAVVLKHRMAGCRALCDSLSISFSGWMLLFTSLFQDLIC